MSELKEKTKKELKEFFKGLGYIGGEVHEVTEDGFDLNDLKSVKDLIDNREVLAKAFSGLDEVKLKEAGLELSDLIEIIMEAKAGFELGAK